MCLLNQSRVQELLVYFHTFLITSLFLSLRADLNSDKKNQPRWCVFFKQKWESETKLNSSPVARSRSLNPVIMQLFFYGSATTLCKPNNSISWPSSSCSLCRTDHSHDAPPPYQSFLNIFLYFSLFLTWQTALLFVYFWESGTLLPRSLLVKGCVISARDCVECVRTVTFAKQQIPSN